MNEQVEPKQRWRHYNGAEYSVLFIANEHSTNDRYPKTVVYQGEWGKVWARPLSDWHRSMTLIWPQSKHKHEWFDARNAVVQSGEMCLCGQLRSGNVLVDGFKVWRFCSDVSAFAAEPRIVPATKDAVLAEIRAAMVEDKFAAPYLNGPFRALRNGERTGAQWIVVLELGRQGKGVIAAFDHDPSEYL